jgi:hypothetical protein
VGSVELILEATKLDDFYEVLSTAFHSTSPQSLRPGTTVGNVLLEHVNKPESMFRFDYCCSPLGINLLFD